MLEGKSKPVYFFPDSTVFADTGFARHMISYHDLLNLRGNFINEVELYKGETSMAIIHEPSFFRSPNSDNKFLVYPGEHLIVKKEGEYNDYTFLKANGSMRRNRELLFFRTFNELDQYPAFPLVPNPSLEMVLELEKQQKIRLAKAKTTSQSLFDSLIKVYGVSKKFKKITRDYLAHRYDLDIFFLFRYYKDTLMAHHLYNKKCKFLIPILNRIMKRSSLNSISIELNEIVRDILPYKVRVKNESEFRLCFDSVENIFGGLTRDYLLSQLMYRAYTEGIQIPSAYLKKYKKNSIDKAYRKVVYNAKVQRRRNDSNAIDSSNNYLLSVDGKRITRLENMLAEHKGKFVFIDFWASWCAPCRDEMPYMKKLVQEYSSDKIVFLKVSIDKEIQVWRKAVIADDVEIGNNYLLINQEKSPLVKQFNIDAIPRYILLDEGGKIINSDTPRPSDPNLKILLSKLLSVSEMSTWSR